MDKKLITFNLIFMITNMVIITSSQSYDWSSALVILWITGISTGIVLVRDLFEISRFITLIKLITIVNFCTLIASGFSIVGF